MKTMPNMKKSKPSKKLRDKDNFLSWISTIKFLSCFALQPSRTTLTVANAAPEKKNKAIDTYMPFDIEPLPLSRMPVRKFTAIATNAPAMNAQKEGVTKNNLSGGTRSYHFLCLYNTFCYLTEIVPLASYLKNVKVRAILYLSGSESGGNRSQSRIRN